ncbi:MULTISPECIES: alpha/beta hydrolase [Idiomarinaceae]|uniref:Alpha/beta hydrolase n=1 Tax=Pseudidiomarina fusca TaxID=2965078 RepID=A0ABU3KXE3_9GAMM|nr:MULTISPECIES: dienelactone hydrolase family protein [Idiomarinaceae]MDX1526045.1 dienelactone hydrolase family protein [Pseudidiomarina maritima]MDT7525672.1 alpha/beta hydrolase [Pseudidiomarina sp. GXY010]MRJ42177.1 carboxylesterase [Idiomarina sp. FeN1]NCU57103.1 carboxylesterase [Idiomarina sp. FenA--70]NCU59812.1 carboxylesterase [Idiomarina sp. FenBw--71]
MSYLACEQIEPQQPATHAIIWLHGLGADGHDFVPLVPHLQLPAGVHARFIFPHAPHLPVTINGGMRMPAWYDILSMSIEREVDEQQLRESAAQVQALIERELERGIKPDHIVLAGFSQGGAVVYEAALSYPKRLAGLLVLSSYLATHQSIQPHSANADLPILVQHGSQDPVVAEALGRHAQQWLAEHNYQVQYQTFQMQHQVCPEQIAAISKWLQQVLA